MKELYELSYTLNLLNWELKVSCPKDASDDLIDLISKYEEKLFILKSSDEYAEFLRNAKNLTEEEQRIVNNELKNYERNKRVPKDFYVSYCKLKNKTNVIWREAKESNNYDLYKPYLKEMIEMTKKYYEYKNIENIPLYDLMISEYESGINTKLIDQLFNELKNEIIPIIKNYKGKIYPPYKKSYTDDELLECSKYLLNYIGFDNDRGVVGIYPHGFTEKMGNDDIRITFSQTNNPIDFCATVIHEGGHGIFEQHINKEYSKYSTDTMSHLFGLHESQSRFYENMLGRNKNFWIPIYDDIKKMLKLDIDIDEFVNRLNTVKPSLIRTESDELTYCLHIIIRYEIERDIFNGNIDVDNLNTLWNQKYKEYLGIDVPNDSVGIMQDVHWSEGEFGYFPSYLLGSIYDGMILEEIKNVNDILKEGKIKDITKYLNENIHINGGAYNSFEVIKRLTGKELSAKPLINYFKKKYDILRFVNYNFL